ncbi:MAG: OsmC family protein [Calditrichaeota bacterium]|jgi:putative redox protein|nr:OsmC family protein [Calditrichota bacterium]MBT7616192.1 OsmC family protein [Calditrichota bacterium]MBT7788184.1 OsmC family protein [Calditrichota bacterium]
MSLILKGTATLNSRMHFTGQSPKGGPTEMDSGPAGAVVAGPTPLELLLQAIAGCAGMEALAILRKRKLDLQHLEVSVEGTKRDEHPRILTNIHITYRGKCEGLTVREMERGAKFAYDKYCSIINQLKSTAEITWNCELID